MTEPSSHYTSVNSVPTSSHLYRNILPDVAKTMARLKRAHPEAELTALPNCGHFLHEDDPEQVAKLMSEFLNRASGQPSNTPRKRLLL